MILADYGAEVIRLEPPDGDPMWEHPAYLLWNRGKKSVAIDWGGPAGRAQALQPVHSADVFIESLRPGEAARQAYDGIINAKSGRMRDQVGWQRSRRPTFRAVNDISYHIAMFTLQAIIAALRVRHMTGHGQKLEGSLLTGVTAPNNAWRRFEGQPLPPDLYPGETSKEAAAGKILGNTL